MSDNTVVPSGKKIRKIIPNTRNMPQKHNTILTNGTGTYTNTGLTAVTNREVPEADSASKPYVFQAEQVGTAVVETDTRDRTAAVIARLRGKGLPL